MGSNTKSTLHKIVILGTPRAGKTSLMVRLAKGSITDDIKSTRGIDFHVVQSEPIAEGIKLQIWDLAGQSHYRDTGMFDDFVAGASGFIFCYDASDASSIRQVDNWIEVAKKHKRYSETKKYLVGLKADMVDQGQQTALHSLVDKYLDQTDIISKHFIVSTHKEINIDGLIHEIIEDLQTL
ncbi:MAG: GTP-binding protein [Candidatus Heimdallarchaeota archaeon]|nr:GTP-binding protein [Candidatus Heimdallarchaeota archaeon]MDH5645463.1 GTP-binding protein [Candidatus Heimdallarchaeota archaeon]